VRNARVQDVCDLGRLTLAIDRLNALLGDAKDPTAAARLLANGGRGMISTMGRDRTTSDPFSMATSPGSSPPTKKVLPAQERRHVLPKDLPNALKHLNDEELDRLLTAAVAEAKRRDRSLPSAQPSRMRQRNEGTASLTRGQLNAVRAAFKAGVTPARIARQFGLSHSDVRKALASEASEQRRID
jgi:hypothetical protein